MISNLDNFQGQQKEYRFTTVHGSPDLLKMSCLYIGFEKRLKLKTGIKTSCVQKPRAGISKSYLSMIAVSRPALLSLTRYEPQI